MEFYKWQHPPESERPKKFNYFSWRCACGDRTHGMFHEDFEGVCWAHCKQYFETQEAAEKAARAHLARCKYRRFQQGVTISGKVRKNSRHAWYVSTVK